MTSSLDGKVAVVTGASSGIGRAIALLFAEEGAQVVVADLQPSPREGGRPTCDAIAEAGGVGRFVGTDLADPAAIERLVSTVVDAHGSIDVLVNNAATSVGKPLLETSLEYTVNVGIACELIASVGIGIGITLVVFFRHQPVGELVRAPHLRSGGPYLPAFLGAVAFTGWAILGFDACGGLSEETHDAGRQVPRATLMSIATVGTVMAISALGLTLATRDPAAVTAGWVADPVSAAVVGASGPWVERPFLAVVVIGFVACGIAEQATLVRVIYSLSRDGMLPLSRLWRRVSSRDRSPTFAVLLSGALATAAFLYAKVLTVLVDFATGAYYVGFLFPIVAVVVVMVRDRRLLPPTVGRRTQLIAVAALVWLVAELVNIAWPRQPGLPWDEDYAVVVGSGALGVVGLLYFLGRRPDRVAVGRPAADLPPAGGAATLPAEPPQ